MVRDNEDRLDFFNQCVENEAAFFNLKESFPDIIFRERPDNRKTEHELKIMLISEPKGAPQWRELAVDRGILPAFFLPGFDLAVPYFGSEGCGPYVAKCRFEQPVHPLLRFAK